MEKELFFITEKAADQDGRRVVTAVVSSEVVDRDGEIVTAAAMKAAMTAYMVNPVVVASHLHRLTDGASSVVGRVLKWWQEAGKTWVDVEFAGTGLGLEYWSLYSGKFQRAFSIGFRPLEGEDRFIDGKSVHVITKIELFEISAVSVPANPDALSKSAKRRLDFVASKRGTLPDIFSSQDDDYDTEDDVKGYNLDPLTLEPLTEFPTKGFYSEGQDGQGDSFSGDGGPCGADLSRRMLADVINSNRQIMIKAFGNEKRCRRFVEFLGYKDLGRDPCDCGFTLDEIKTFGAIEREGIDAVIRSGLSAPGEEDYRKPFLR